jgi:chromosome partitioning protein
VRDSYDFILVDCPPSLGLLTLNTLAAADTVLIPIQCEFYALEGLSQLLNTVRLVQRSLNPRLQIEGVLLTMYDQRLNLSRQVSDEANEYFGARVYRTAIPRNVRLAEAPSFGKPIVVYDILSAGAQSYLALANEVITGSARGSTAPGADPLSPGAPASIATGDRKDGR